MSKNLYYCSDGSRVTESTIKSRYSNALQDYYSGKPRPRCAGCGHEATCTAHIIAKARLKVLHKTELIWAIGEATFPACFGCNYAIENPKGEKWKYLHNIDYCLEFISLHDPELFAKFETNR